MIYLSKDCLQLLLLHFWVLLVLLTSGGRFLRLHHLVLLGDDVVLGSVDVDEFFVFVDDSVAI